jgi:hypothetical protein
MRSKFMFMTSGEAYELDLPAGLAPTPESSGTFSIGNLTRPLIFEPSDRRQDPDRDQQLVRIFTGVAHGRSVAGYRVRQTPALLVAFWQVRGGYVHTFVDSLVAMEGGCDADLPAMLKELVSHIAIADSPHGPFAALSGPLGPPDPREPSLRDRVTFRGEDAPDSWNTLVVRREPPWARTGTSVVEDDTVFEARATTSGNVSVIVFGNPGRREQLKSHAVDAASTLTPL